MQIVQVAPSAVHGRNFFCRRTHTGYALDSISMGIYIFIFLLCLCQVISGVLVRLNTCKRLTNSLPKLSLINAPPRKNGGIAGRPDIRADLSISKRFHSLGIPGRVFFKFDMGKV